MTQTLIRQSRQLSAATLVLGAFFILCFAFVHRSRSADPVAGTLNPSGGMLNWVGTSTGGASPEGETTCVTGVTCESYTLTLSGTPADWVGKKARIVISATQAATDYDVYIHKGNAVDVTGKPTGPIAGSGANSGTPPEVIELDPNVPSVGTGVFMVHVVYWLAPATDQYAGKATVETGVNPTPTPGLTPTPTPTVPPGTPRFVNHYAPPGVMDDAGEPTMGVNWNTENKPRGIANTFKNKVRLTGVENQTFNGGTSLYYGGVNDFFLRATFDDCASPALVQWDKVQLTIANAPRAGYDPLLYTDHWTGRTFVLQEFALTPAGSSMEFTDNDGDNMFIAQGGGPSGVDHQTVGGGPLRPDPITGATPANVLTPKIPAGIPGATPIPDPGATPYPHGVYYASQSIATATSQRSIDGGFSYPQQVPMFTAADCAGLHGHLKVAEDGTAYVPDKACSPAGVPFVFGGNPAIVVSEDNGATWNVRLVPNADSDAGVDDPSVGVSWCPPGACSPAEKAERSKHIYMGFMYTDGRPGIAYSNNKGVSWQRVVDLGALSGIKHIAFPAVAVGDPDRAAFTFFGTTTAGNYNTPEFPGVWHQYVATTFDFGQTWQVQNVSGDDPIQRGGICGDGTCRNLLDFIDIQIDKQGRVLVAGEDGCIGGCVNGGPNSFTAKAYITRQSGGKRMFSIYDPQTVEPTVPGAPQVFAAANANNTQVTLSWPTPDTGGSTVTAYKVYRSASQNGPFTDATLLATVTQPGYVDSAVPAGESYYVVTAINAIGESPYCKAVKAEVVLPPPSVCELPGRPVSNDLLPTGADNDSGANTPIDPRVNAKILYVAEPFIGAGVEQLVFTLQVGQSTATNGPPNSQWYIIWNRQAATAEFDRAYVAMKTDVLGNPTFEYGNFGVPLNPTSPSPTANTPVKVGDADATSSYDPVTGIIKIAISNSKLRAMDGAAAAYQPGRDLANTNVRTYFNRPDPGQRSQNNASDITADGTYGIQGNASCAPQLVDPIDVYIRKMHGTAGVFDIRIGPLPQGGTPVLEPRRGEGPNNATHHAVFVFPQTVTFTGATATPEGGGSATVVGTTPANGPSNEVTVSFTASNAQTVTVNLNGVSAGAGSRTVSVPVTLLLGDVNVNGAVTSSDIGQAKAMSGNTIERDTFKNDVSVNGIINSTDISLIKQQAGTGVPANAPAKAETTSARE